VRDRSKESLAAALQAVVTGLEGALSGLREVASQLALEAQEKATPPRAPMLPPKRKPAQPTRAAWARERRLPVSAKLRQDIVARLAEEPNRSQAIEAALAAHFGIS
jgi:hypothetical protein